MKKYLILLFVAAAAAFQSCDNNDDLWDAIDDLKSRVQALETQVNALNDNVKALQTLYSGATVSEVKNEDGKCTITLTDGKKLTLVSDIDALVPVVSINEETGMWQYSIGGGEPQSLNVKAVAEDGKTPTFQVTDDGYWQVDLGDGQGWRDVTYADGSKVSAITDTPTEDKFFQTVEVVGDSLHIVMQNGDELDIPIVKGFLCQIVTQTEGVQLFDMGVTKEFTVNMRGVENWILTAPEGWTAELSEPTDGADNLKVFELSVTSPAPTRATASTAKDVSILASSGKYSCIAKIQVESTGIDPNAPRITVSTSTSVVPTYATLTFDVVLTNATTWKYICQPSSEQAPTADEIMSTGTEGSGTSVTVSGLEGETDYTIYVVAYDGAAVSDVASAQNRTLVAPVDYYTVGYEVDGVTYSSATPDVQLITETSTISTKGVYFLDPKDGNVVVTLPKLATSDLVIIGRYSNVKPKLKITGIQSFNGASGVGYIFKNLDITASTGNYVFNYGSTTGEYANWVLEDCNISHTVADKVLSYFSNGASSVKNILVRNNRISLSVSKDAGATRLINFNATAAANTQSIIVENNNIYAPQYVANGTLIFMPTSGTSTSQLSVSVVNNTFVNYIGQPNGFINLTGAQQLDVQNNIFWAQDGYSVTAYMFRFYVITEVPSAMNVTNNIFYGLKSDDSWAMYHKDTSCSTTVTVTRESTDPFAGGTFSLETGTFIPGSSYAGYGSTLQ
ncbi:PL29 family lyase N-terminal domain-containing protein [uncultured Alistipes sp.]|uniref:PL29 family lyase N-terminal domain-containing protein n=1 Tax=uncultured Alistipes sp. TaxID=538949 RepID=UPI002621BD27|nr:PL29 family lyase N-terminal domain-containing protein [uncultured Alistipes sp.]